MRVNRQLIGFSLELTDGAEERKRAVVILAADFAVRQMRDTPGPVPYESEMGLRSY